MPKVDSATLRPTDIYGKAQVDNSLTMGERIRKRFKPTDTVKIHNITNMEIQWQWLEESDEKYVIEDGSNVKIVTREDPGLWRLGPGEMDILMGSCAYIMIEALYKQTSVLRTGIVLHPLDEREIKNFGFDDPQKQEEFIDMVFRGKVTPQMMQQAAMTQLGGDFTPKVTQQLAALPTEKEEYERRTSSHVPGAPLAPAAPPPPAPEQHTDLSALQDEFQDKDSAIPPTPPPADDAEPDPAKPVSKNAKNAKTPAPANS